MRLLLEIKIYFPVLSISLPDFLVADVFQNSQNFKLSGSGTAEKNGKINLNLQIQIAGTGESPIGGLTGASPTTSPTGASPTTSPTGASGVPGAAPITGAPTAGTGGSMLHQCLVLTFKSSFISFLNNRTTWSRGKYFTSMLSFDVEIVFHFIAVYQKCQAWREACYINA